MASPAVQPPTVALPNRYPSSATFQFAAKYALEKDKPIFMDYWVASLEKTATIGVRGEEKLLVKSAHEFTSPIGKMFKSEQDLILETENSIYIVDGDIKARRLK